MPVKFRYYKEKKTAEQTFQDLPDPDLETEYNTLLDAVTKGAQVINGVTYRAGVITDVGDASNEHAKMYYFYKDKIDRVVGQEIKLP